MEREIHFGSWWGRGRSPREPKVPRSILSTAKMGRWGGQGKGGEGSTRFQPGWGEWATESNLLYFPAWAKAGFKNWVWLRSKHFKEVEIHHQIAVFWCWTEIFYTYNVWVLCNDWVMTRKFIKSCEFNFHFWVSKGAQQSSPSSAFLLQKFPWLQTQPRAGLLAASVEDHPFPSCTSSRLLPDVLFMCISSSRVIEKPSHYLPWPQAHLSQCRSLGL